MFFSSTIGGGFAMYVRCGDTGIRTKTKRTVIANTGAKTRKIEISVPYAGIIRIRSMGMISARNFKAPPR